ncbi:MAG: hypothetical protein U9R66_06045 [Thermodesulfobacteriota bacterium]|nr:hypothetical protein [Thermodesulfobacteriota bacterium]
MKFKVFFLAMVCWLAMNGPASLITASAQGRSESDIQQRQRVIEEHLNDGRRHAGYCGRMAGPDSTR